MLCKQENAQLYRAGLDKWDSSVVSFFFYLQNEIQIFYRMRASGKWIGREWPQNPTFGSCVVMTKLP